MLVLLPHAGKSLHHTCTRIAYTPAVALNLDRALTTDFLARLLVLAMPVLVIGMADEVVLMPTAMLPREPRVLVDRTQSLVTDRRRYRRPRIAGNVSLATPRHVSPGPERASTLRPVPGWPQQEQTVRRPLRRPSRI